MPIFFWGVDNARRIVGITLADAQRDEVRRLITEKLRRTKPPLPTGARFVEPHQVYDANGNAVPDLFVLEVGVAPGEEGVIYVSENDSVYIRSENTTAKLTTTELIAEIRRRERNQLLRPKR